jgi:hypothetical protein
MAGSTKLQNKNSIGNVTINTGIINTKEGCGIKKQNLAFLSGRSDSFASSMLI